MSSSRRIVYEEHARDRMAERHISEEQVQMVLMLPDEDDETPLGSRRLQRTFSDGNTLRVWVLHPPVSADVVTVRSCGWSTRR